MEWLLVLLLLASIPVFYFYGIVHFFTHLSKNSSPISSIDRVAFLRALIKELSQRVAESPTKKIITQLTEYRMELARLTGVRTVPVADLDINASALPAEHVIPKPPKAVFQDDIQGLWSNWYSHNSINLLLYIGAFLIVAAASIFVGFQWETIGGIAKAILLMLLTAAFFFCGLWFYRIPKVKQAGTTFTAIGALLLPLCGYGWYTFVLRDQGVSFGSVWVVTSIISFFVYVLLAWILRSQAYTYVISLATLSFSLALVNVSRTSSDYYILASILSCFLLLFARIVLSQSSRKEAKLYVTPLDISGNVLLPASLVYGFIIASSENLLLTPQVSLSLFLAAAYYAISYYFLLNPVYVAATELLYPLSLLILFLWHHSDTVFILSVLEILSFCDIGFGHLFMRYKKLQETDLSIGIGMTKIILLFLVAMTVMHNPVNVFIFGLLGMVAGLWITWIKHQSEFSFVSFGFLAVSIYVLFVQILHVDHEEILTLPYLICGVLTYGGMVYYQKQSQLLQTLLIAAIGFFVVSGIFALSQTLYLVLVSFVVSSVLLTGAYFFENCSAIFGGNAFLAFTLLNLLRYFQIDISWYPVWFMGFTYCFYVLSYLVPKDWRDAYQTTGLVGGVGVPALFGFISINYGGWSYDYAGSMQSMFEQHALLTGYAGVALTAFDSVRRNRSDEGYFASALGVVLYVWQMWYLGMTEWQIYSLPIGTYFLVIGYLRKLAGDMENYETLSWVGIAFVLLPTILQSLGTNGFAYSLVLALEGIILVGMGISLNYKQYTYAGIFAIVFAIISQTYSYIFALPRWVVVGVMGLAFIAVAMYLMTHRKEDQT